MKQQFIKFKSINLINGKSQTNWYQKLNLLLLQRHCQSQRFRVKLVKNWILDTLQLKGLVIVKMQVDILKANGNKYLIFEVTRNENKELLKKYVDVWDVIKNEIKTINGGKENDYGKDNMKIELNSDDDLPLKKPLKFHLMTIIIWSVFEEDGKLYPQLFLDDTLHELV